MPITVECGCGKRLRARDELAGRKAKCPGCGTILRVPGVTVAMVKAAVVEAPAAKAQATSGAAPTNRAVASAGFSEMAAKIAPAPGKNAGRNPTDEYTLAQWDDRVIAALMMDRRPVEASATAVVAASPLLRSLR